MTQKTTTNVTHCVGCGADLAGSMTYRSENGQMVGPLCAECATPTPDLAVVGYGWACPRCRQVNAPWVGRCSCPTPAITTIDTLEK